MATKRRQPKSFRCRRCGKRGFAHAQAVQAHRIKVHGETWGGAKRKRAARAEVNGLPLQTGRTDRIQQAEITLWSVLEAIPTPFLVDELGRRAK